jgi:hypothetical protein
LSNNFFSNPGGVHLAIAIDIQSKSGSIGEGDEERVKEWIASNNLAELELDVQLVCKFLREMRRFQG